MSVTVIERALTPVNSPIDLPVPVRVPYAALGPLTAGTAKSAQIRCRAATGTVKLQHLRSSIKTGELYDVLEVEPLERADALPLVDEQVVYAGPISYHFGHMVAEAMHRLWALTTFEELRGLRAVFQEPANTQETLGEWFWEVVSLLGIEREQIVLLREPCRFRELIIPVQGRVLGGVAPIAGYEKLFPLRPVRHEAASGPIYLSRSRYLYNGSFFGERLVEERLSQAGFEIIHPELLPVEALVSRLIRSPLTVFCEGSAIHNLELAGRIDGRVFVIGRRPGSRDRFSRLLAPLCGEFEIFESIDEMVTMTWDAKRDRPNKKVGSAFIDLPGLFERLSEFCGLTIPPVASRRINRSVMDDVLRYLADARSTRSAATDENLGRALRALRQARSLKKLGLSFGSEP